MISTWFGMFRGGKRDADVESEAGARVKPSQALNPSPLRSAA
jgi:hypothetical protein